MNFKELSPKQQSYARALLYRVTQEAWQRGEQYAQGERVGSLEPIPKGFRAIVRGTQAYEAEVTWCGSGLSKKCTCPASGGRNPCKHLIALAIVADQSLGIPPPDAEEVESEAVPPPLISRTDIEEMYRDPLNVNLTTLRLAASESGSWSRPHSRLPDAPKMSDSGPLSVGEIKQALKEIERWSRHRNFDLYFCAGEMMAGFCYLLRLIGQRAHETSVEIMVEVLEKAAEFHHRLVFELIDDSEGVHQFGEAHLQALIGDLHGRKNLPEPAKTVLLQIERGLRE
ncbi:MAG: SWIM zinc finger family protein [Elusimicrobia bacterium]|nr:SWIM zinc finger family protein [Elusimicrobiota bacterium]